MAGKTQKKTLRSQYTDILNSQGIDIRNCKILAFKFVDKSKADSFHFALMDSKLPYLLYDGATDTVKVVVSPDNADSMISFAESKEGKKTVPSIDGF